MYGLITSENLDSESETITEMQEELGVCGMVIPMKRIITDDNSESRETLKVCVPEKVQQSDSDIPLYALVEQTKTPIATPEKKTLEDACDSNDLTETKNSDLSRNEKPVPSSTCSSVGLLQKEKDTSKSEGTARGRKLVCWVLLVVVAVVVVGVIACLVVTFVGMSTLKSVLKSLQQNTQIINRTSVIRSDTFTVMFQSLNRLFIMSLSWVNNTRSLLQGELEKQENNTLLKLSILQRELENTILKLSLLQGELEEKVNNTLLKLSLLQGEFEKQENNSHELIYSLQYLGQYMFPAASCARVLLFAPSSPSGYYWVRSSNGSVVRVYCDMTRSCGGVPGGWMRVAELDVGDNTTQCPSNLTLNIEANLRTCVQDTVDAACTSVYYPTKIPYLQVCGMIKAYQVRSPDGFIKYGERPNPTDISTNYVDGVSVTHGMNPRRQHIWTFAAGACPCDTNRPLFVANDFFCDGVQCNNGLCSSRALWDGAGCGPQNTCCSFNNPPWFYKQLPQPTTDDIEMRVCRDQRRDDEDIAIEVVEFYIR